MNKLIIGDLYRIYPIQYKFKNLIMAMRIPGFCFLYFFRLAASTKRYNPLWLFYRLILRHFSYKFGFQIPLNCKIGAGFYLGHFGHIIVSPEAVIGKNCNLGPGVTIGKIHTGSKKGAPIINDNVWIGTNSVIVGGIIIGRNVLIAPGSFVNFDIPDKSLVIGNPAKIIQKDNPTLGYINNIYLNHES